MLRSLYSAITGLQNHQTRMDVIGNNISNVNTTGFKKSRVNFQDLISQTIQGASRPNQEVGGVNPKQVGLGMQIASIDTIHTQGSLRTTGVKSDLALQGDGFLVLREGERQIYTRFGAFSLDRDGALVNPSNGFHIQGWQADNSAGAGIVDTSGTLQDIIIPIGSKDSANPTAQILLSSNLDKNTALIPALNPTAEEVQDGTWTVEYDIFDSFGNRQNLRIDFIRVAGVPNQWQGTISINPEDGTGITANQSLVVGGVASADQQTFLIDFSNDGTIAQISNIDGGLINTGDVSAQFTFDVPESSIPIDPATGLLGLPQTQTISVDLGQVGSYIDSITQFASPSTTRVYSQNGYGLGYLEDYQIDQSGIINGIYSNGTNRPLGQLAIATFTNSGGLDKVGDNNYRETNNSGLANIGISGSSGRGSVIAGALELSNVDLAEEFTDMIVTQRGFQANSRTITTSDELLQELLTLKR